jgi:hypothetical protein
MKQLNGAHFATHNVPSGGDVQLDITWTSNEDGTLYLDYDAGKFMISPETVELPASGAGHTQVDVTFTRLGEPGPCDVHFTFGPSDDLDWVAVA